MKRAGSSFLQVLPGGATSRRTSADRPRSRQLLPGESQEELSDVKTAIWAVGLTGLSPGDKLRITDRLVELYSRAYLSKVGGAA